jgi:hypothetical protein
MIYISSAYGNRYAALLAVFLWSLRRNCFDAQTLIYWQDIDEEIIGALTKVFSSVRFEKTHYEIAADMAQRISSKIHLWSQAVSEHIGSRLCLLDSDVLVIRSPSSLWDKETDIVFTDKDEQFQLNTGVMLVHSTKAAGCFFREWLQRTVEIINNPALLAEAVSPRNHYGGADQMALHQQITYTTCRKNYEIATEKGCMRLKAVPCSILNETNSVPLADEKFIYHYKGGWRQILFEGKFPPYRSEKDSLPMYILYLQYHSELLRHLKNCGVSSRIRERLRLKIPRYFDIESGKFNKAVFSCQSITRKIQKFFAAGS